MTFRLTLIAFFLALMSVTSGARATAGDDEKQRELFLEVEDTNCWVSIAKVHLSIDELRISQDGVIGEYSIRVPLKKSKNEDGVLNLALNKPLDDYVTEGGILKGSGTSAGKEGERTIVATIVPDSEDPTRGQIGLEITTDQRIMAFQSTYRIVGGLEDDRNALAAIEPAQ